MKSPKDIVGSSETMQLFVADYGAIRQVNLTTNKVVNEFIKCEDFWPHTLSLSHGQLTITSYKPRKSVYVYDIADTRLLQTIKLETFMDPQHAVKTNRGTFLVCFTPKEADSLPSTGDKHSEISEVNTNGHAIKTFDGQAELSNPYHIAIDSIGYVLVANKRGILQLTEDLKFKCILTDTKVTNSGRSIVRLFYDKQNGTLIAGLDDGCVNIYKWS